MLKNEADVLDRLIKAGVEVPRIYSKFTLNKDHYLALEHIEGQTLEGVLVKRQRRLSIDMVLQLCSEVCTLLGKVHQSGWIWRDCKPSNLILTSCGKIRPLDFEGAMKIDQPEWLVWQTKAYLPPLSSFDINGKLSADDMFAAGVICYFLLTGRIPETSNPKPSSALRRRVPIKLQLLVKT